MADLGACDLGRAARLITEAAVSLPITVPAEGLAVLLMRRLDLAIHGAVGPVALASERTCPAAHPSFRRETLVDRAVEAALAGRAHDSLTLLELAEGQGGTPTPALPGLDPMAAWILAGRPEEWRLRLAASAGFTERPEPPDTSKPSETPIRRGVSCYDDAMADLCAGTTMAASGRWQSARERLLSAEALFLRTGAHAWARLAHSMLARAVGRPLDGAAHDWEAALTEREQAVARLVARGAGNKEIARLLHLSSRTVEAHHSHAFRKLGLRSRVELAILISQDAS